MELRVGKWSQIDEFEPLMVVGVCEHVGVGIGRWQESICGGSLIIGLSAGCSSGGCSWSSIALHDFSKANMKLVVFSWVRLWSNEKCGVNLMVLFLAALLAVTREKSLFEEMDRTDELVTEGDGSELNFLSPQALKQLEKEKLIRERKRLRQQKRAVRHTSSTGHSNVALV